MYLELGVNEAAAKLIFRGIQGVYNLLFNLLIHIMILLRQKDKRRV